MGTPDYFYQMLYTIIKLSWREVNLIRITYFKICVRIIVTVNKGKKMAYKSRGGDIDPNHFSRKAMEAAGFYVGDPDHSEELEAIESSSELAQLKKIIPIVIAVRNERNARILHQNGGLPPSRY